MVAPRSSLPKAYLRIDPNIDRAKADTQWAFIRLLCEANRQPRRGIFKSRTLFDGLMGKPSARRLIAAGDVVEVESGQVMVPGWVEWQEGDISVGDRMRRMRARRESEAASGAERTAAWRLRNRVFERDHHSCRYCGNGEYPREWLALEHVDPNGPSDEANLVTACRPCNKRKGNRTPEEAGMVLLPVTGDASHRDGRDASQPYQPAPSTTTTTSSDRGRRRETSANGADGPSPIEIAVHRLMAPRMATPAQVDLAEDIDAQVGGGVVLATIENLIDEPPQRNPFGVLKGQLLEVAAAHRPHNGRAPGPKRNRQNDYDALAESGS